MSYLVAGLLLGFSSAYIAHAPLTMGKVAVLISAGLMVLAGKLSRRHAHA